MQNYVIKFDCDLRQVGGISVSSTNKTDCHDITGILLIVALNTININQMNGSNETGGNLLGLFT
jgi:hypothetical protein